MPQPRIYYGSIIEGTPMALYALIQREDDATDLDPGDVNNYDLTVYDQNSSSGDPDTALGIWQVTGASPTGIFSTRQPGVGQAPSGYTFKRVVPVAGTTDDTGRYLVTEGGRSYRGELVVHSDDEAVEGACVIWIISVLSRSGT